MQFSKCTLQYLRDRVKFADAGRGDLYRLFYQSLRVPAVFYLCGIHTLRYWWHILLQLGLITTLYCFLPSEGVEGLFMDDSPADGYAAVGETIT